LNFYDPYLNSTIIMPVLRSCLRLVLLLLLFSLPGVLRAQLVVSPNRVVLGPTQRGREMVVRNASSRSVVITADIRLLILQSDSIGAMRYDSSLATDVPVRTCSNWVKVFPRKFTIAAGASRTIRVLAVPPDTISDGEYLGRLVVNGTPVDAATLEIDTTKIQTKVTVEMKVSMPIMYRKGSLSTDIDFHIVRAIRGDTTTAMLTEMESVGNSAYRGTLYYTVRTPDGKEVAKGDGQVTVETRFRQQFDVYPRLAPGQYTVSVEARTERMGTAAETVIPAPPKQREFKLVVAPTGDGSVANQQ
jgi:P pilus assembly chaperone PapD